MKNNDANKAKHFTNSIISFIANCQETPTRAQIEEIAKVLSKVPPGYSGDLQDIINDAMISVDTRMGAGVSLVDVEANHDDKWVNKRSDLKWTYTHSYEEFLRTEGWPPQMVQSLSDVTGRILGHLENPLNEGTSWNRRGLVIGHVQSGKTANYTGLIARAADSGYKFIIVIAGIHNNLRKQTQQRIDEAFIGRSSDPLNRRKIGVGLYPGYPCPATLTNVNEDFNKDTAAKSGWTINDFSKPIILVIKKNVTTLIALHKWLKELNAEGDGIISDIPMLLIDDEADNASINTNKQDIDPTKTNATIRRILGLFAKSCYVGYTATPFANIFINPDSYDNDVREELFPRDFIYCLDAPTTYFGAEKVFLNEETSGGIVREINDAETLIPLVHKRESVIHDLPESLYKALDNFIIARAIRNLRGQSRKHCSMIINVSRFVPIQNSIRDFLSLRERKIREAVRTNYLMPETISSKNEHMNNLKASYLCEFSNVEFSWEQVKSALNGVFEHLHLYVINSKSDEVLDYERYDKEGIGLTAIAIGGLSLSRGLTIEGLTISYMYRNTKMYDTLMQMGRWFGYRPGFEDLCRVFLTRNSINWYSHIALAADELTQQVKRMRRDKLSPRQFGLYVKSHPDSPLLITASNKMRNGEKVKFKQNLSGRRIESYIVSIDKDINDSNFKSITKLWIKLNDKHDHEIFEKGIFFKDVDLEEIEDFIINFKSHVNFSSLKDNALTYLKKLESFYEKGDVIFISPKGIDVNEFALNPQVRTASKIEGTSWRLHKDRVSSGGDEKYGLSEKQLAEAIKIIDVKRKSSKPSDMNYREVRNKPLLMIHSIEPQDGANFKGPIAAFGITFPVGLYETEIEVVANKVWLESMQGTPDDPDDEEDYDE